MLSRNIIAVVACLAAVPATAGSLDFSFLVQQEIAAFQCPDYEVENPFDIEPAIMAEGSRLGWTEVQTRAEMNARREHQLKKLMADPDGYCALMDELGEAYLYRLEGLLGRR